MWWKAGWAARFQLITILINQDSIAIILCKQQSPRIGAGNITRFTMCSRVREGTVFIVHTRRPGNWQALGDACLD